MESNRDGDFCGEPFFIKEKVKPTKNDSIYVFMDKLFVGPTFFYKLTKNVSINILIEHFFVGSTFF